mmetsp:Transcript_92270/g.260972  ORF Transcript_92270/g.260972 Transcript_92270/m.260972 type:complete len:325 (-) Transcript_92270:29-1003(-)
MAGVHDGEDPVDLSAVQELLLRVERLDHGPRVCQAGGLDEYAVQRRAALLADARPQVGGLRVRAPQDALDGIDQVAAHGAAEAAVVQDGDGLLRLRGGAGVLDQLVVYADLPNLVLDDGELHAVVGPKYVVKQRGLASAEEAGENGDWHLGGLLGAALPRLDLACRQPRPRQPLRQPRAHRRGGTPARILQQVPGRLEVPQGAERLLQLQEAQPALGEDLRQRPPRGRRGARAFEDGAERAGVREEGLRLDGQGVDLVLVREGLHLPHGDLHGLQGLPPGRCSLRLRAPGGPAGHGCHPAAARHRGRSGRRGGRRGRRRREGDV